MIGVLGEIDRESRLGSWLRRQRDSAHPDKLVRLQTLEPAQLFMSPNEQWRWYMPKATEFQARGGDLRTLLNTKKKAMDCNLGQWLTNQHETFGALQGQASSARVGRVNRSRGLHPDRCQQLAQLSPELFPPCM